MWHIAHPTYVRLGCVTCFSIWHITECDFSTVLKYVYELGFTAWAPPLSMRRTSPVTKNEIHRIEANDMKFVGKPSPPKLVSENLQL